MLAGQSGRCPGRRTEAKLEILDRAVHLARVSTVRFT